jgi:3-phenylpropionate/trans-cinnamate dioxygenase ferredoxin subunit
MTSEYTRVAKASELAAGAGLPVTVNGREILLCNSEGRIAAIINKCSHAEEKLDCGRIRNGWISCPAHGARFDLETGEPLNHVASEPIEIFPVRVVDDWIEVQA